MIGSSRLFSDRLLLAVIAKYLITMSLEGPSSTMLLHRSLREEEQPLSDCSWIYSSCTSTCLCCFGGFCMFRTREVRYSNDWEKWSTSEILPQDSTMEPNMLSPSVLLRLRESLKMLGLYCPPPKLPERMLNWCFSVFIRLLMFILGFNMICLAGLAVEPSSSSEPVLKFFWCS